MTELSSLLGAARLREMLDEHAIKPRKSLGQNFVVDPNTIRKVIAATSVQSGDRVLEIGAGVGSLTLGLLDAGARVIALEIDPRLVRILRGVTAGRDVEVIEADALSADLASYAARSLVANLPYNIAATVVLRVLETAPSIESAVVMTQREVGERFAADPGSKTYGATSVLAGFYAEVAVAGRISRRAFYPVPNVDSVLIRFVRRHREGLDHEMFRSVVKTAFAQRRKTLRQGLAGLSGSSSVAEQRLADAGVSPKARPEELSVDQFIELARVFSRTSDPEAGDR